jgi:hypothetical protein
MSSIIRPTYAEIIARMAARVKETISDRARWAFDPRNADDAADADDEAEILAAWGIN